MTETELVRCQTKGCAFRMRDGATCPIHGAPDPEDNEFRDMRDLMKVRKPKPAAGVHSSASAP